jgi:hypothetical protein
MTPRQQKEARALVQWYIKGVCRMGLDGRCIYDDPQHDRWHDRARLWLRQTAPKKKGKK